MKKSLWFLIFTLAALFLVMPKKKTERPLSQVRPIDQIITHTHEPSSVVQEVRVKDAAAQTNYMTLLSPENYEKEESVEVKGLPRGMRLLSHIKAVASENYQLTLGPAVMMKDGLTYFRHTSSSASKEMTNVVYDHRKNTFHPVSATIKLTNVDQANRQKIVDGRFAEHHYNEELKLLYLQSNHQELLQDYKDLYEEGLEVGFEVIQGVYQTK